MNRLQNRFLLLLLLVTLELAAAAVILWWLFGRDDEPLSEVALNSTPVYTPQPTLPITGTVQATQVVNAGLAGKVPTRLVSAAQTWATSAPGQLAWVGTVHADLAPSWAKGAKALPLAEIVLVPVAPFYALREDISFGELRRVWQGQAPTDEPGVNLFALPETAAALDTVFGPRNAQASVSIVSAAELTDRIWTDANALAVVPFDQLEPRLKVLSVDGLSALDRDLDLANYPLVATVWANWHEDSARSLVAELRAQGLDTNRHIDRLTVVAMTGVTALARLVAHKMEAVGDYGWPARHVAGLLASADLTHVSNEVSFVPGCQAELDTWVFCSRPGFLETLRLVGTDLVELTGNHNLDFGPQAALQSLDLYAEADMQTFGGGRNAAEARQPALITHHGNRLAFLGYNQFGPDYAWATGQKPGAARFSPEAVQSDLAQVRPQADVVFVNIQHTETYEAAPLPEQVADFRATVQAGADVVTGS